MVVINTAFRSATFFLIKSISATAIAASCIVNLAGFANHSLEPWVDVALNLESEGGSGKAVANLDLKIRCSSPILLFI